MTETEELRQYRLRALIDLMSDISEECYCAGWMHGNEYRLWDAITNPNDDRIYGFTKINDEQIERLRDLSRKLDGWVVWDDEVGERFVTIEEWERIRAGKLPWPEVYE